MHHQQSKLNLAHALPALGDTLPLTFGIYSGNATGFGHDASTDDPMRVTEALSQLQPSGGPLLVRCYEIYVGSGKLKGETPRDPIQYAGSGRQLDLALCYCTPDGDLDDWTEIVRSTIRRYRSSLAKIQITEEPNNPDPNAGGNGSFPNVREAIIAGVLAAKDEVQQEGYNIQVGFNATPSFNNEFWESLGSLASPAFMDALDYVGFDFFPDVFRPLPPRPDGSPMSLIDAVTAVLTGFRRTSLPAANIPPSVPIHITENGWPTSPTRSYEQQANVLETIVRTVYALRAELNITHYEYFGLRDTVSSDPGLQFGLMRDDYTPKPAFSCYQRLIAEFGTQR